MSTKKRLRAEDYTIGWLCALARSEQVAAIKMLDVQHEELPKPARDHNTYTYGSIGSHYIVIACLPLSHPGTTSASRTADLLPISFPNMRLHLFVGIGGGIPRNPPDPDPSQDIHLGDVVVGVDQTPGVAGVVQYDFIRHEGEGVSDLLGILDKPHPELLTALGKLFSNYEMGASNPHVHLARLTGLRSDFSHPPPSGDRLYQSTYKHMDGSPNCDQCSLDELVIRNKRQLSKQESLEQNPTETEISIPVFHQGQILSGNSVIKDAKRRDELSRKFPHARCFEMEAAGVVDQTQCLVIRGIADYADSHKNQMWQPYAAGTAAAFARELLLTIQPSLVEHLGSIAPTADSGNVHWMVPKSTNTLFTGRTDILEKLGHHLAPQAQSSTMSEQQKRFVIIGYGGIGKSEVCLKFANDHRQQFWGIFWIDASSEETAKQSFVDIGKMCGTNAEKWEQVKAWLANTSHPWLLIIDNADNIDIDYATFFPSGNKGSIILTTRNTECRDHGTIGSEDLDHLDLQDATSLLLKAAGLPDLHLEEKQKAAKKVVQDLGFHTLAIVQAGAFIKLRRCPLESYSILFKKEEEQLLKYHPKQAQSTYGSVFATFEISATCMESSQDQSAADALSLLRILGFIHFEEIPELIFWRAREEALRIREKSRGRPLDELYELSELQVSRLPPFMMEGNPGAEDSLLWRWRKILNLLESYSIIKVSETGEHLSFSMHPLAHKWTRVRHGLSSRKEGWRAAGSVIALSMWETNYNMFHEKLRSHVRAYLDHLVSEYLADMAGLEFCQTHYHICYLVFQLSDIPKLRFLLQTLERFKTWTNASGRSKLPVQYLTAFCILKEGQPEKAIELSEQLVENDGPGYHRHSQLILALAYAHSNQYQKAVPLLEHVVEMQEGTLAPEHSFRLMFQHELGEAYFGIREFDKSANLLEQVVEIQKRELVPTHPSRLTSEEWLGTAYIGTKQFEKAAKILEYVMEVRRRIKNPFLLGTQSRLAEAYIGMGNGHYGKAAELLEHVVEVEATSLTFDDPNRLSSQYWLTKAYIGMGDDHYGRAAELLEHMIEIEEKRLTLDDSELLGLKYWLVRAYIGMGDGHNGRTAELLEHVVEIEEKTLAADDPSRLASQELLEEVNRLIEAEMDSESASASSWETMSSST